MKSLTKIRQELAAGRLDFSRHAFRRAVERNIRDEEIRAAGERSEPIEEYPKDKYSPSVLLLGFTSAGRPLHIQASMADSEVTRIITLYEPDAAEWAEFRRRR